MTANGFLRALASAVLLLAAPTTCVQPIRSLIITSSDTDTIESCSTEILACQEGAMCVSCTLSLEIGSSDTTECTAILAIDDSSSSTMSCDEFVDSTCCYEDIDDDCLELFDDNVLSFLATKACSDDELTCNAASGGLENASTLAVFSCAFALLLPLLLWA